MTQNQQILAALRDGKRISPLSALQDYDCMRLAARIYDLRDQGWDIESVSTTNGKATWMEYKMAEDAATSPASVQTDWRSV